MNVIVTGAGGFLGRNLVKCLETQGLAVIPVSRRPMPGMVVVPDYYQTPVGDVLIHLAEESDRGVFNKFANDYSKKSSDLVSSLCQRGYKRIIFASSSVVYGDNEGRPFKVSDIAQPIDAYGRTKLINEGAVLSFGGTAVRFSNIYGNWMSNENVISDIIRQLPHAGPLVVRNASSVRDFLHVSDAVAALSLLCTKTHEGIINVGTGEGTSIGKVAKMALDLAGKSKREIVSLSASANSPANILDITETVKILGWAPKWELSDYLRSLIKNMGCV